MIRYMFGSFFLMFKLLHYFWLCHVVYTVYLVQHSTRICVESVFLSGHFISVRLCIASLFIPHHKIISIPPT